MSIDPERQPDHLPVAPRVFYSLRLNLVLLPQEALLTCNLEEEFALF